MKSTQKVNWTLWTTLAVLGVIAVGAGTMYFHMGVSAPMVHAEDPPASTAEVPVTVVRPQKGAMERVTTQPGSVLAFESVHLFAKVPGYLKCQHVDIGDRVKHGQVLAVVDVPELEKQVQRNTAALKQTESRVNQMEAHVDSAKADLEASKAAVLQAEASQKSAAAWVRYRLKQHTRMKDLFALKSIEEAIVDETKERYEASVETEQAAEASIHTSKARVTACTAKVRQADADLAEAKSEVLVARAELEKAQVMVSFATIVAPFDGVITHRSFFPGDFIRAATEGSGVEPLLTVDRTDLMRVVVQVPDRDVPYTDVGDAAVVVLDALPEKKINAKVSRLAESEDPQTRLMRVEIDVPNPSGKMRQGMYGRVTIILDKFTEQFSIPSSCLVGKAEDGVGTVYVVRDRTAHLATVRLGFDNGLRVEILGGLRADDQVILQPGNALADGTPVFATLEDEAKTRARAEH